MNTKIIDYVIKRLIEFDLCNKEQKVMELPKDCSIIVNIIVKEIRENERF